jgi:hypothetical protein
MVEPQLDNFSVMFGRMCQSIEGATKELEAVRQEMEKDRKESREARHSAYNSMALLQAKIDPIARDFTDVKVKVESLWTKDIQRSGVSKYLTTKWMMFSGAVGATFVWGFDIIKAMMSAAPHN